MKELEFLEIIKNTLSKNTHIGDDCAFLTDLGIVLTQDTLVEDVHFSLNYSTPYQLGYKSIMVNLSDIFASGAIAKYLSISLSLPKNIDNSFVKDFYKACEDLSKKFDVEVIGGDITGSEKVFISICAIGLTKERNISSRSNAKVGDCIIVTGSHGSSAAGLWLLNNPNCHPVIVSESYPLSNLVKSHLETLVDQKFSTEISTKIKRDYAMMDTSDGLADALFKIAKASDVQISVDFDKIPYDKAIEVVADRAKIDFKDWILYGGEDYKIVACLDEENLKQIKNADYTVIGRVKAKDENHFVEVVFGDKIETISNLDKTFNHFKEQI